jgi:hypothetical protein
MNDERCPACDGWACDNECLPYWRGLRNEVDELRAELLPVKRLANEWNVERARLAAELEATRAQLATVTLYAQRTTAQLRDEERENAALRRRLREGGR